MDFNIQSKVFKSFLSKCKLDKIVNDLMLQGDQNNLFARFTDNNNSMYCEVIEHSVKIKTPGNIRIASLEKVLSCLSRFQPLDDKKDAVIRIVSDENAFIITDGQAAGSSKVKLSQLGEAEFIESYQSIRDVKDALDKQNLIYAKKYHFTDGFEVPMDSLLMLVKDAKAFGFEIYKFYEKDGILNCSIEDKTLGEAFNRRLITEGRIGTNPIPTSVVGVGFKEIVNAIDRDKIGDDEGKKKIKLYFNSDIILITDGSKYYYNLHTLLQE